MKCIIALTLCVVLVAGTAYGNSLSKVDTERSPKGAALFPVRDYFEGFETTFPPVGWTQVINCVTDSLTTWTKSTNYIYPDPYEGICAAFIHWQYGGCPPGQDEWLKFNYTLTTENTLSFATQGSTYWCVYADFVVTINGNQVWSYCTDFPGASWEYEVIEIDLSAYVGQTIEIGFGYVGDNGADHYFDAVSLFYQEGPQPPCCPFPFTCYTFDFNMGACGVQFFACDGVATWAWGVPVGIPTVACDGVPVTHVLGTTLGGAYPINAGHIAAIGPVHIDDICDCLEICHFFDTESPNYAWDGGNVKVSGDGGLTWTLVYPHDLYPGIFPTCDSYYHPPCVCGEEGFYGDSGGFVRDCFDLSAFAGSDVLIGFHFGSDSYSTTDLGWYIKWVKVGGQTTPVEDSSWGSIKALYR